MLEEEQPVQERREEERRGEKRGDGNAMREEEKSVRERRDNEGHAQSMYLEALSQTAVHAPPSCEADMLQAPGQHACRDKEQFRAFLSTNICRSWAVVIAL